MKKIIIIIFTICFGMFSQSLFAEKRMSGTLYGPHHKFTVFAPENWVVGNQSGVSQGLHCVVYPEGSSWKDSMTVMYTNVMGKSGRDLKKVIQDDVSGFVDQAERIKDGLVITTSDGKKAYVKYFLHEKNGNNEAIAYIDEKHIVAILAMVAKDDQSFREGIKPFKEFVESYYFESEEVNLRTSKAKTVFGIPDDILKKAKKNSYSKDEILQNYEKGFAQNYGPVMGGYLNECAEKTNKNLKDFMIVLKVEKDGSVSIVYADKHGATQDCLVPKMLHAKLPPPPLSPYYELIETRIKE